MVEVGCILFLCVGLLIWALFAGGVLISMGYFRDLLCFPGIYVFPILSWIFWFLVSCVSDFLIWCSGGFCVLGFEACWLYLG